ncbi:MAG: uroporphyrinogen-III synthase [Actinobacteria bacterium]|nr:uroporphyrinogen-III synthase [Actinomycetota bacterium]
MNEPLPLAGWRVGVTADRRADAQLDLLRRRGADVLHGCTMKTLDLTRDKRLVEVSRLLAADPPDTLILETGMGLTMWLEAMDEVGVGGDLRSALAGVEVVARGPKAVSAARRAGLEVAWSAPGEQFAEIVRHVADTGGRRRIALQLDGTDEATLVAPLAAACDEVVAVPVYRWALPDDTGPARALVDSVCAGEVGAVTFTTRQAAVHLVEVAAAMGRRDEMVSVLDGGRVVPVSVGPVCSTAMRALGMSGLVEPERARLVAMIDALADHAASGGSAG